MKLLMLPLLFVAFAHAQDAKTSFANTMAFGVRTWKLTNVDVKVTTDGKVANFKCSGKYLMTLKGDFPKIEFTFGGLDCGKDAPSEILHLGFIAVGWEFEAKYVPVASDPNQFKLWLTKRGGFGHPRLKQANSMNAQIRNNELFMDFLGEEEEDQLRMLGPKYHYFEVTLKPSESGKPELLNLSYQKNDHSGGRSVA